MSWLDGQGDLGDMFYVTTLGHSTFDLGEEDPSGEIISYTVTVSSTASGLKYFIDALTFEVGL